MVVPFVADATPPAALRVVSSHPLVLRGDGFDAGEHVVVTVAANGERSVTRTKAPNGSFRITFRFAIDRCGTVVVVARGDHGSVARRAVGAICTPPPRD